MKSRICISSKNERMDFFFFQLRGCALWIVSFSLTQYFLQASNLWAPHLAFKLACICGELSWQSPLFHWAEREWGMNTLQAYHHRKVAYSVAFLYCFSSVFFLPLVSVCPVADARIQLHGFFCGAEHPTIFLLQAFGICMMHMIWEGKMQIAQLTWHCHPVVSIVQYIKWYRAGLMAWKFHTATVIVSNLNICVLCQGWLWEPERNARWRR